MFLHNDVKKSLLTKIPFVIVCFLGGRILTKRITFKASRYIQPPFTGSTLPNKGDKLPFLESLSRKLEMQIPEVVDKPQSMDYPHRLRI